MHAPSLFSPSLFTPRPPDTTFTPRPPPKRTLQGPRDPLYERLLHTQGELLQETRLRAEETRLRAEVGHMQSAAPRMMPA